MKHENRYEKLLFLQRFIAKYVGKLKKAAPRFELGIKDLQSSALPLGHAAERDFYKTHKYTNSRKYNSLIIICNGHGEDLIAAEIIKKLLLNKKFNYIEIMPLVGDGKIFDGIKSQIIKKIGFQKVLPSGGFSNQSLKGFVGDLKAGMLIHLLRNWLELLRKPKNYKVLAIGDLLPLLYAWSLKSDFGFIGTPKSDHTWMSGPGSSISDFYHRLKGSEWDPWEVFLMRSSFCKFVIVRDELTSENLNKKKINSKYLGNPMMDFVLGKKLDTKKIDPYKKLILLIGSRFPEAYKNLNKFLTFLNDFHFSEKCLILIPLSANAKRFEIEKYFVRNQFVQDKNSAFLIEEQSIWLKNNMIILLGKNQFNNWAKLAEVGLGNAGTATEQICGLGTPVLSLPGKGPQFTKSFAFRQQRLLGGSVRVCTSKEIFHQKLSLLLNNRNFRRKQGNIGLKRMGPDGASQRIVNYINLKL